MRKVPRLENLSFPQAASHVVPKVTFPSSFWEQILEVSIAPPRDKYEHSTLRVTELYSEPILDTPSIRQPNDHKNRVPGLQGLLRLPILRFNVPLYGVHVTDSVLHDPLGFEYPLYEREETTR
jgi:hypothetical protein